MVKIIIKIKGINALYNAILFPNKIVNYILYNNAESNGRTYLLFFV